MKNSHLILLPLFVLKFTVVAQADSAPTASSTVSSTASSAAVSGPAAITAPQAKSDTFTGTARKAGKIVYIETHTEELDATGNVTKSVTEYRDPENKLIARLSSDFAKSLTVPEHKVENFRTGNEQGIRWLDGKIIMYNRDKNKSEETKSVSDKDANSRLMVGCHGLSYYMKSNLTKIEEKKTVPVSFLIPGKLDFYDFEIHLLKESPDGIVEFEIAIENFLLKLFAPKIQVKFDKTRNRILTYRGLSNISDDKGNLQDVEITYSYP